MKLRQTDKQNRYANRQNRNSYRYIDIQTDINSNRYDPKHKQTQIYKFDFFFFKQTKHQLENNITSTNRQDPNPDRQTLAQTDKKQTQTATKEHKTD